MMLLGGLAIATIYGTTKQSTMRQKRRDYHVEKRTRRAFLLPMLETEDDIVWLRKRQRRLEVEEYLMRDVPGWEVGKSCFNNGAILQVSKRDYRFD